MESCTSPVGQDTSFFKSIPDEVFRAIVERGDLGAKEVGRLASCCHRLSSFIDHDSFEIWIKIARQTFPTSGVTADLPLAVQLESAASEGRGKDVRDVFKEMCTRLPCRCCNTLYLAGDPHGCRRHPGVLISGHRMNGLSATWTCCGDRQHARGCEVNLHTLDPDSSYAPSHNGHAGHPVCGSALQASSYTSVTGTGVPGSKVRGIIASSKGTFLDMFRADASTVPS